MKRDKRSVQYQYFQYFLITMLIRDIRMHGSNDKDKIISDNCECNNG